MQVYPSIPQPLFPSPDPSLPQPRPSPTPLPGLKPNLPPIHPPRPLLPALIQPPLQILTLANIKQLQLPAALDNRFHADARHPDASADGQFAQLEEVQGDGAERGVRDRGAAEGEAERAEGGAAEGEYFSCGVGEGAAE